MIDTKKRDMKRYTKMFENFDQEEDRLRAERAKRKAQRVRSMRGMFGTNMKPEEIVEDIQRNIGEIYTIDCIAGGDIDRLAIAISEDTAISIAEGFYEQVKDSEPINGRFEPEMDMLCSINVVNEDEVDDFLIVLEMYATGYQRIEDALEELIDNQIIVFYDMETVYTAAETIYLEMGWEEDEEDFDPDQEDWDEDEEPLEGDENEN
jgi:hypothetical protein